MLWIALHLPRLPLEALPALGVGAGVGVGEREGNVAPAVVVERQATGPVVGWVTAAAHALGISSGMSLAGARSRCAGLQVAQRDQTAEARLLEQLALAALRYTPRVVMAPDGLALEVQASLRLFKGERRLWDLLQADMRAWGLSVGWAAAPTCEGARLLAVADALHHHAQASPPRTRRSDRAAAWLDALPLALVLQAWGVAPPLQALLQGLGLRTLGELRQIPREGLERRAGAGLLERLDRAYGRLPEPQVFHAVPEGFEQALEMPEHTDRVDLILLALQRLMLALAGWLTARHRAAQVFSLRLVHDSPRRDVHPDTRLTCRLCAAETDPDALLALLREQLGRQALPAPVRRLVLQLEVHTEQSPQTSHLKWTPTDDINPIKSGAEDAPLRLIDQLRARLGADRILTLHAQPDHRPEQASGWRPASPGQRKGLSGISGISGISGSSGHSGLPGRSEAPHPPRPCWLLTQPEPLVERQGQLWQGSRRFILRSRPERIEAGWFDGEPTCRDYHIAQGPDDRLAWVFRDHRRGESAWFLHGWFG